MVAHPGRQHSHQAALALYKRGLLGAYWTGVPAGGVAETFPSLRTRFGVSGIPPDLIRWCPVTPLLRKMGTAIHPGVGRMGEFAGHRCFDRLVAFRLRKERFAAIIGYETSSVASFSAARRAGILTVLDAAAVHHTAYGGDDRLIPARLREAINADKEREIELADAIIVTSELARQTYAAAGVPAKKLSVIELGVDVDFFRPAEDGTSGPFTFAFVGSFTPRKGLDLLLEAFSRVRGILPEVRLRLFGSGEYEERCQVDGVSVEGRVPPKVLARELPKAGCLVLPSRIDSYGLVVGEAFACGVPVIVSDAVGAGQMVEEGRNGWVVRSEDIDALTERMSWVATHRQERAQWRSAARTAGLKMAWPSYHERFTTAIQALLHG